MSGKLTQRKIRNSPPREPVLKATTPRKFFILSNRQNFRVPSARAYFRISPQASFSANIFSLLSSYPKLHHIHSFRIRNKNARVSWKCYRRPSSRSKCRWIHQIRTFIENPSIHRKKPLSQIHCIESRTKQFNCLRRPVMTLSNGWGEKKFHQSSGQLYFTKSRLFSEATGSKAGAAENDWWPVSESNLHMPARARQLQSLRGVTSIPR